MPQQNRPITRAPKDHDESTGNGSERHGKHREEDEALAGKGSTKGGMNRDAGAGTKGGRAQEEHGKRNPNDRRPGSNEPTDE